MKYVVKNLVHSSVSYVNPYNCAAPAAEQWNVISWLIRNELTLSTLSVLMSPGMKLQGFNSQNELSTSTHLIWSGVDMKS